MVGLPCLASQCAKLHIAGWTWTVLIRVCLESCTWQFSRWIRERNSECASNFVPLLGYVVRRLSQWFNKPSGTNVWVVYRCFNGMPGLRPVAHQLTMTNKLGDAQAAQPLKLLHEFKSSSVRIDVGPFTTLLWRWELVMGHANGFWRKNCECTMSQPSPWQRPFWHFRLHPPVSAEKPNGCHPPPTYSPDIAPCDFFLFPKMKLKLKGRRFNTTEEIQAELQRVLDTLTEKDFQEGFQKWRWWDQCLDAGENYFEGDGGR